MTRRSLDDSAMTIPYYNQNLLRVSEDLGGQITEFVTA